MNILNCEIKPDWAGTWEGGILDAWNQKAAEYDCDMKHSNRARFVERSIRHDPETILDIGAGTGVFRHCSKIQ